MGSERVRKPKGAEFRRCEKQQEAFLYEYQQQKEDWGKRGPADEWGTSGVFQKLTLVSILFNFFTNARVYIFRKFGRNSWYMRWLCCHS